MKTQTQKTKIMETQIFKTEKINTIKEEIKQEYKKVWTRKKGIDEKMVDYCMNKISLYLKTEDGYFYILEKEKLNTKFFISEGSNRSMEEALNICKEIKTKEDFFIEENLSKINYLINTIKNNKNNLFFAERFKNSKIVSITTNKYNNFNKVNRKLTTDEEAEALKLCEKFKEMKTKKINSYLKRFGLSKIQANTYWIDR